MKIRNPNLKCEIIRQSGGVTELRKQVKETIKYSKQHNEPSQQGKSQA